MKGRAILLMYGVKRCYGLPAKLTLQLLKSICWIRERCEEEGAAERSYSGADKGVRN